MLHVKVQHSPNLVIKTSDHSVKKTTEKKENFVVKDCSNSMKSKFKQIKKVKFLYYNLRENKY